jgi:hypothetical protein
MGRDGSVDQRRGAVVCACVRKTARVAVVWRTRTTRKRTREGTRHVAGDVVQTLGYDLRSGQCQVPISISVAIEVVESRVVGIVGWAAPELVVRGRDGVS